MTKTYSVLIPDNNFKNGFQIIEGLSIDAAREIADVLRGMGDDVQISVDKKPENSMEVNQDEG